jgi:hypothetical protein
VAKRAYIRRLKARETETMPLVPRTPMALEIACCALTNRVTTSFTSMWNEANLIGPTARKLREDVFVPLK